MQNKTNSSLHFFKHRSLIWLLTLIIVIAVTLVTVISLAIHLFIASEESEKQFAKETSEHLLYLQASLEIPLWNYDTAATRKLGQMMMSRDMVVSLRIQDHKGNQLYADKKKNETDVVLRTGKVTYRNMAVGSVELGLTKRLYRKQQERIFIVGLLTILAAIIGIYCVVTVAVRYLLKVPLARFAGRIDALTEGNYEHDGYTPPYVEFMGIMERFNVFPTPF